MEEFEELKRKFDHLKLLVEDQEPRLHYYETRAQNVAMAYLIWERLFVFGMSQASSSLSLNCTNWWTVLGFSLSCTSVYFLFFLEAVIMLNRSQNHLDVICKKQIEICQQILNLRNPDDSSDGLEFSFHVQVLQYLPYRIVQRKVYVGFTVSALLAVTAFELYMCKYSLCK